MAPLHQYSRIVVVTTAIILSIFMLVRCGGDSKQPPNPKPTRRFAEFAGSDACRNCHRDVFDKHLLTEHHLTSAPASPQNILGSFQTGKNSFVFNPFTEVRMEQRDTAAYQVEYDNGEERRKGRFDIVIGSGRKGQSYLNWLGNRLVQLPITYFSPAAQWSNSPGYPPGKVAFYRPITSRCLECHTTYLEKTSDTTQRFEQFDRQKIVFAVDCEKCHGPAAAHVQFQTSHPEVKQARFIVNPGTLPRERLLDLCSLCHGGQLTKTKPSFTFQAGDTLTNYFSMQAAAMSADNIDVHGNQMGLLSLSKCYTIGKVTCITCHNVHENENGKTQVFSARCVTCHSPGHSPQCRLTKEIGVAITTNCIDCHMPKQLSHAVAVYLQGNDAPTPALMRTHFVKTYPDATAKLLPAFLKKRK